MIARWYILGAPSKCRNCQNRQENKRRILGRSTGNCAGTYCASPEHTEITGDPPHIHIHGAVCGSRRRDLEGSSETLFCSKCRGESNQTYKAKPNFELLKVNPDCENHRGAACFRIEGVAGEVHTLVGKADQKAALHVEVRLVKLGPLNGRTHTEPFDRRYAQFRPVVEETADESRVSKTYSPSVASSSFQ